MAQASARARSRAEARARLWARVQLWVLAPGGTEVTSSVRLGQGFAVEAGSV